MRASFSAAPVSLPSSADGLAEPGGVSDQSFFQQLADLTPVGLFRTNAAGETTFVNARWCEIVGLSAVDALGTGWTQAIHPDDRRRVLDAWQQAAHDECAVQEEYRFVRPDGSATWVIGRARPERAADGRLLGYLGSLEDITALKESEARAHRAPQELARHQDAINEFALVTITDRQGRILSANERFCEVSGYARSELIGQSHRLVRSGLHPSEFFQQLYATIYAGQVWRGTICNRARNGSLFWIDMAILPVRDADGQLQQFIAVATDITAMKRAEEALQNSMARLQTIFHAVNSGLVLQDQQYRILECNSAAEKILGLTRDQLLGLSSVDPRWRAVHEDGSPFPGETHPAVVTLQTGQALRDIRMGLHRPGHGLTWISINTEPVRAPDGQVTMVVVSFEDITERLRVEERLLETQKLESLGLLAGGIAHDFNNILTGIMGNASLAEVELLRGGTVGQYLAEVTRSAQRASELCQQMLAYSGRGHFILHRLDLSWLVSDTSNLIAASISKKATLQQQLSDELPPVDVDPSQIRQVIMNLVINASEALGDQDGVITISTGCCHPQAAQRGVRVVSAEPLQAEYVFLEVADTGTGIEVGSMARIFDPFYTTKFTGRGLGLSAVLGIVRGHKGVLDVDSVHGQGTTFRLYLPTSAARAAGALSSAAVAPDWQGSGRVLLVDDEETVRDIASRLLQLFGFEVDAVCDGYEAVETFRRNPQAYRFVLLDLTMPRMSGSQAIAELRRIREDVRVVLMSGYSEQDARASFDDLGLTSFVQKPFGMSALRNAVMQATLTPAVGTPAADGPATGV